MRRGHTLVEILVVTALFTALAFLLLAIYQVSLRARSKEDAHDTTYRASMLALEQVRERLRGCQVLEPADPAAPPVNEVKFRYPELDEAGVFVSDGRGEPVWAGTATLLSDAGGTLVCSDQDGTSRRLAQLGAGGGATFRRLDERQLEIRLVAVKDHPDVTRSSRYELNARFALANQP